MYTADFNYFQYISHEEKNTKCAAMLTPCLYGAQQVYVELAPKLCWCGLGVSSTHTCCTPHNMAPIFHGFQLRCWPIRKSIFVIDRVTSMIPMITYVSFLMPCELFRIFDFEWVVCDPESFPICTMRAFWLWLPNFRAVWKWNYYDVINK